MNSGCQQITEIKKGFINLLERLVDYKRFNESWESNRAELQQLDSIYQDELQNANIEKILDSYLESRERLAQTLSNERMRASDGGPGSGNFGHKGRPGQVGGSSKEGGSELAKVSVDPTLADIDDHLAEVGIRKGDVVKAFGLRKDVLLTHLQNRLKDGDKWRGVFKNEEAYNEAKSTLDKLRADGVAEDDKAVIKLKRSIARWDFVQGLASKLEGDTKVEEPKREEPKLEEPKAKKERVKKEKSVMVEEPKVDEPAISQQQEGEIVTESPLVAGTNVSIKLPSDSEMNEYGKLVLKSNDEFKSILKNLVDKNSLKYRYKDRIEDGRLLKWVQEISSKKPIQIDNYRVGIYKEAFEEGESVDEVKKRIARDLGSTLLSTAESLDTTTFFGSRRSFDDKVEYVNRLMTMVYMYNHPDIFKSGGSVDNKIKSKLYKNGDIGKATMEMMQKQNKQREERYQFDFKDGQLSDDWIKDAYGKLGGIDKKSLDAISKKGNLSDIIKSIDAEELFDGFDEDMDFVYADTSVSYKKQLQDTRAQYKKLDSPQALRNYFLMSVLIQSCDDYKKIYGREVFDRKLDDDTAQQKSGILNEDLKRFRGLYFQNICKAGVDNGVGVPDCINQVCKGESEGFYGLEAKVYVDSLLMDVDESKKPKKVEREVYTKQYRYGNQLMSAASKLDIENEYINTKIGKTVRKGNNRAVLENVFKSGGIDFKEIDVMGKERAMYGISDTDAAIIVGKLKQGQLFVSISNTEKYNNKMLNTEQFKALLTSMTISGQCYSPLKSPNMYGSQNLVSMLAACGEIVDSKDVNCVRYENMDDQYRNYNFKVGDTITMDGQHASHHLEFADNNALKWFGGRNGCRFEVKGSYPRFNIEAWVSPDKSVEEYEQLIAGFFKVTKIEDDKKMKYKVKEGDEEIEKETTIKAVELEFDWDRFEEYLSLQARSFANYYNMYGKDDKDDKEVLW